ncbi:hypothetical protein PoB_000634000 [Plakobranchus ocellatus]|uniref:Uncharacterized protein n=1 Tax=Plakobranchus ocellatus TaxID=259542 RepID=A0AAV3Y9R0_9GAST|nr:hypothetical protein PoB_000634000 [Plakobranchus ocellatus]
MAGFKPVKDIPVDLKACSLILVPLEVYVVSEIARPSKTPTSAPEYEKGRFKALTRQILGTKGRFQTQTGQVSGTNKADFRYKQSRFMNKQGTEDSLHKQG